MDLARLLSVQLHAEMLHNSGLAKVSTFSQQTTVYLLFVELGCQTHKQMIMSNILLAQKH